MPHANSKKLSHGSTVTFIDCMMVVAAACVSGVPETVGVRPNGRMKRRKKMTIIITIIIIIFIIFIIVIIITYDGREHVREVLGQSSLHFESPTISPLPSSHL